MMMLLVMTQHLQRLQKGSLLGLASLLSDMDSHN